MRARWLTRRPSTVHHAHLDAASGSGFCTACTLSPCRLLEPHGLYAGSLYRFRRAHAPDASRHQLPDGPPCVCGSSCNLSLGGVRVAGAPECEAAAHPALQVPTSSRIGRALCPPLRGSHQQPRVAHQMSEQSDRGTPLGRRTRRLFFEGASSNRRKHTQTVSKSPANRWDCPKRAVRCIATSAVQSPLIAAQVWLASSTITYAWVGSGLYASESGEGWRPYRAPTEPINRSGPTRLHDPF